jgi:glucose-1-phosphate adenylyltransferase
MASMGIYVFSIDMLTELLNTPGNDFGKDLIPNAMADRKVMGYVFDDYWADIGTIRRFYEVNLEMASANPPFNLKDADNPVYTHARFLPPCEVYGAKLDRVLLTDGCLISDAEVTNSVIGLRSVIGSQAVITDSVIMGADYYETEESRAKNRELGRPDVGIGEGSMIEAAIVDKNVRIGKHVQIRHLPDRQDEAHENWVVREGLVIIPKSAVIPDDMVI